MAETHAGGNTRQPAPAWTSQAGGAVEHEMTSNRVTLDQMDHLQIGELAKLPAEQLAMLIDDVDELAARAKRAKDWLNGEDLQHTVDFRGTYEEYVERCGDDHLDVENAVLKARREKRKARGQRREPGDDRRRRQQHNRLKKRRDTLTDQIEKAEARVHSINELFCNPGFFDKTPEAEVRKLEREQKGLSEKVEAWMEEWEEVENELSELTAEPLRSA